MSPLPTATQVSAGGVAYRHRGGQTEVALILVGPRMRWQLPKGAVNIDERIEDAALREVHEEAGVETQLLGLLDRIEYWFYATRAGQRVRFHKYVHFYLLRYLKGDVNDHDHEVEEARWVEINQAIEMLAFDGEKEILRKALTRLTTAESNETGEQQETPQNKA